MRFRKVRNWVGGVSVAAILLALWVFWPLVFPPRYPCALPSLEPSVPRTVVSEVGAGGYYQHVCPVPLAQEMVLNRTYGVIQLKLWGSPHRLYMSAVSTDGRPLAIRGARVEDFGNNVPDSPIAKYTSRVTFLSHHSVSATILPVPETLGLDIYDDDQWLEAIELRYAPQRCDCVAPL